ncbi:SPOR domain-containing protein [Vibrio salinus]|uniref:SPOR domain-containing protein n=1 Tax=Vibrio salinus TaxID=2899784 RepID=UPI001E539D08|nr:SPOR domain-containing protein [Vibrio salinus]MCE0493709.1 SPOR domain-containing protein [Vibrio salinus]
MTSILQITVRTWGIIASFIVLLMASSVNATPFICDATQSSSSSLPVLSENCPIGKGLWGKQLPPKGTSSFWIQCGVFKQPLSLMKAKAIYDVISTDVWMKPENNAYRCLVGPYDNYKQAQSELKRVQSVPSYKKSFIRAFAQKVSQQPVSSVQKAKAVSPKLQKDVKKPSEKAAPIQTLKNNMVIRRKAVLDGIEFMIPFIDGESVQFYMEYDKPWNRMSFADATKTCASLNMKLATVPQWKKLLNAGLMKKEKWPMYLPYWGKQSTGLFTSGKTSQLKGTSLLNVLCVRI